MTADVVYLWPVRERVSDPYPRSWGWGSNRGWGVGWGWGWPYGW